MKEKLDISRMQVVRMDTTAALQRTIGLDKQSRIDTEREAQQQQHLQDVWNDSAQLLIDSGEESPKSSGIFATKPTRITNDTMSFHVRLTGDFTRMYSDGKKATPVGGTVRLETLIPQSEGEAEALPVYEITVSEESGLASIKDHTRLDEDHTGHTHTEENMKVFSYVLSQMENLQEDK